MNIEALFHRDELDYLRNQNYQSPSELLMDYLGGEDRPYSMDDAREIFDYLYGKEEDSEPRDSHDLSDDAAALASAGWGTDEDYGDYGGGEDW